MPSVPLPFLAGLVFALTLYRSLKGVDVPGSRRFFYAFLILYALQGIGVGLRFGYGMQALVPFLPVSASIMPPLAYLAFRALAGEPLERPWLHGLVPLATAVSVAFFRDLVDPLLLVIFFAYGIALYRFTLAGPSSVAETPLQRTVPALRAARLTAGLMFFFALSDAALAVYAGLYGPGAVPMAVGLMNVVAMAAVLLYYFAPEKAAYAAPENPVPSATAEDRAVLARVEAALEENALYRDDNLSLARLARKAGLPAREVSAAVNRTTGLNVSQFVNNRRIAEACRLLRETEANVTRIMFDAGFSTKSNFNREFRRVQGVSPAQYRAGIKARSEGAQTAGT